MVDGSSFRRLSINCENFDGATLKSVVRDVNVEPLTSRSYVDLKVSEFLQGADSKNVFVYCELLVNGNVAASHDYFFAPFKELKLSKPTVTSAVTRTRDGFSVKLSADKFAKAVYLAVPDNEGFFSDNFFNLAPGREMTVAFHSRGPALSLEQFKQRLQIRSVFAAF